MGKIIIVIAVIVLLLLLSKWLKSQYHIKGRPFAVKALLISVAIIFVVLAASGRVHWVGALLASLLAGLRFALPLLIRSLPLLQSLFNAKVSANQQQTPTTPKGSSDLSVDEALEVLGLEGKPSKEDIIEAHRRLIQKLHPDRGGNDYLAAKLNQAKEVLLAQQ